MIIFELPLPPEFVNVSIDNNEKIDTTKDFFWFANVIKPYEQREIPTTEEMKVKLGATNPDGISPSAVGYFSDWAGDTTYYTALYVGIDYVQAWSLPYGSWKALDIKNQSTWTNSFKIAEHVDVNG